MRCPNPLRPVLRRWRRSQCTAVPEPSSSALLAVGLASGCYGLTARRGASGGPPSAVRRRSLRLADGGAIRAALPSGHNARLNGAHISHRGITSVAKAGRPEGRRGNFKFRRRRIFFGSQRIGALGRVPEHETLSLMVESSKANRKGECTDLLDESPWGDDRQHWLRSQLDRPRGRRFVVTGSNARHVHKPPSHSVAPTRLTPCPTIGGLP